jgi:hypothetical protein
MSAPSSPAIIIASSGRGPGNNLRGSRGNGLRGLTARSQPDHRDMRVSDADRAAVADELSRHYGEGRLDQDEFSQRLDQAMTARTYQDLTGLLHDLPHPDAPAGPAAGSGPAPRRRRRRSGLGQLAVLALVAILLFAAVHAIAWALTPLLWIGVLSAIALLAMRRRSRRR